MITKQASTYFTEDFQKKAHTPFLDKPIPVELSDEGAVQKFSFVAGSTSSSAIMKVKSKKTGVSKDMSAAEVLALLPWLINEGCKPEEKEDDEYEVEDCYIEGVASTCSLDLEEEKMSIDALKSMKQSALNAQIPLRNAHSREWDAELGVLTSIELEGSTESDMKLVTRYKLNDFSCDPHAKKLWHLIANGKHIGLSIGGIVLAYHTEFSEKAQREVIVYDSIMLHEVSVTAMPANVDTFVGAVGKSLVKSMEQTKNFVKDDKPNDVDKSNISSIDDLCKSLGHTVSSDVTDIFRAIINLDKDQRFALSESLKSLNSTNMPKTKEELELEAKKTADDAAQAAADAEAQAAAKAAEEAASAEAQAKADAEAAAIADAEAKSAADATAEAEAKAAADAQVAAETEKKAKDAEQSDLVKSLAETVKSLQDEITELKSKTPAYRTVDKSDVSKGGVDAANVKKSSLTGVELNSVVKSGRRIFDEAKSYTLDEARTEMNELDPHGAHKSARGAMFAAFDSIK